MRDGGDGRPHTVLEREVAAERVKQPLGFVEAILAGVLVRGALVGGQQRPGRGQQFVVQPGRLGAADGLQQQPVDERWPGDELVIRDGEPLGLAAVAAGEQHVAAAESIDPPSARRVAGSVLPAQDVLADGDRLHIGRGERLVDQPAHRGGRNEQQLLGLDALPHCAGLEHRLHHERPDSAAGTRLYRVHLPLAYPELPPIGLCLRPQRLAEIEHVDRQVLVGRELDPWLVVQRPCGPRSAVVDEQPRAVASLHLAPRDSRAGKRNARDGLAVGQRDREGVEVGAGGNSHGSARLE
jgi:hypothetical protein